MALSEFILANREPILAEWEAFARSCAPASGSMDVAALRDHAEELLSVMAADLATPQGALEQSEKSKGHATPEDADVRTAAEEHGAGRAQSGFTVEQMVAEYRALRASVIRLWTRSQGALQLPDLEDLTRFNEAIDQSLAESVTRYNQELSQAKEIFLGVLGHDLRTPLGAIYTSAKFMLDTGELGEPHHTLTARIATSSQRAVQMVGDLLDFTRGRLGGGIPVTPEKVNLGKVLHDVVAEISAANPGCIIQADTRQDQLGQWDAARLAQALGNIIGNAVHHGAPGSPVTVELRGEPEQVAVAVHNQGPVIPPERMNGIFNPMKVAEPPAGGSARRASDHLGLGLFIAERIVTAHGGRIEVESSEADGTRFTMLLPRQARSH